MPNIIQKVQGTLSSGINGSIVELRPVVGQIQNADYIRMTRFRAYVQNLVNVEDYTKLTSPMMFGLETDKNSFKLEISY